MANITLTGATSGSTTLAPTDGANATLTLPTGTGTVVTTANPISGSVIQVVQGTYSTETSYSTSTLTDSGLTATITPKFATSKILVMVHQNGIGKDSGNTREQIASVVDGSKIIWL